MRFLACALCLSCVSTPPAESVGTHAQAPMPWEPLPPPSTAFASPPAQTFFQERRIAEAPAREPQALGGHGAPVDLDVKGADIHDVCRLLADVGRVNIVVADDVSGSVTLKLKRVPWDRALAVVLEAKGFRARRDGNVIVVTR